jgi:hypothetical protein
VWPQQGALRALVTIKKHVRHVWLPSFPDDTLANFIESSRINGENAYFALAAYSEQTRKAEHAQYLRCLWADLDVGEHKPYASQEDAIADLIRFCNDQRFPRPTWLINSGNGIQAYWVGDDDLTRDAWQDKAERFFKLCQLHDLSVDPAVARDSARILRLPSTLNCKDPANPKETHILMQGDVVPWSYMETLLPPTLQLPAPPMVYAPINDTSLTMALSAVKATPKSFVAIMNKSFAGTGCNQLAHCVQNRMVLEEPLWRAGLSIAKFCEDAEIGIQLVSLDHPDYTPEGTLQKLDTISGPYRCDTIDPLRPGVCALCPHKGRITSPIQLGHVMEAAADAAHIPPEPTSHPVDVIIQNLPAPDTSAGVPWPYMVGADGLTYKYLNERAAAEIVKKGGDLLTGPNGVPMVKAYQGSLQLIGRAYDHGDGEEMFHLSVRRGCEKNRFAKIASAASASKEALRKSFKQGAILNEREATFVQDFISQSVIQHKEERQAAHVVTQAGWDERMGQIVYGRWAMMSDGTVQNVLPMSAMDRVTSALRVSGNASHWVRMADYWNAPGYEAMAFTLLSAFGAPLMRMMNLGTNSGLIHLFTPESGYGKSAVQSMICAVYGNPRDMMMTPQDTINSMMSLIGTYNNFPICVDEITNHPAQAVSGMVYQFTQGREKTRMSADAKVKQTSGNWDTIMVSSGNASLIDKLCALKASPEGELMRFLELRPNPLPPDRALSDVMTGIQENYGMVGVKYLYNLVAHQDKVREIIQDVKSFIAQNSDLNQAHRFWVALLTANLAGGRIAQRLGFINYDMDYLTRWAIETVHETMHLLDARVQKGGNMFGNLLAMLAAHTITVPDNGLPIAAKLDPKVLVNIKERRVCISVAALMEAAQTQQVSVMDMTTRLIDPRYRYVGQTEVNLTQCLAGTMAPIVVPAYEYRFTEAA